MNFVRILPITALLALTACMDVPQGASNDGPETASMPDAGPMAVPGTCAVPPEYAASNAGKPLSTVIADWPQQYQGDIKVMKAVLAGKGSDALKAYVTSCYGVSAADFK